MLEWVSEWSTVHPDSVRQAAPKVSFQGSHRFFLHLIGLPSHSHSSQHIPNILSKFLLNLSPPSFSSLICTRQSPASSSSNGVGPCFFKDGWMTGGSIAQQTFLSVLISNFILLRFNHNKNLLFTVNSEWNPGNCWNGRVLSGRKWLEICPKWHLTALIPQEKVRRQ